MTEVIDLSAPSGRALATMLAAFAEFERGDHAQLRSLAVSRSMAAWDSIKTSQTVRTDGVAIFFADFGTRRRVLGVKGSGTSAFRNIHKSHREPEKAAPSRKVAMNTRHSVSSLTLIALVTGLGACAVSPQDASIETAHSNTEALSIGTNTAAIVGSGYDSARDNVEQACITATTVPSGTSSASLSMSLNSSYSTVTKTLGFQADGKAHFGLTEVSAAAQFAAATTTEDLALTYVFQEDIKFPDKIFNGNYSFTTVGDNAKTNKNWYSTCGDQFVTTIHRGAALYTLVKIRFNSTTTKEEFEANVNVTSDVNSFASSLKSTLDSFGANVGVEVRAYQVGGSPADLGRVVGGSSVAMCALGNNSSCLTFLDAAISYASDGSTGFPSQFTKDSNGYYLDGNGSDTGYETASWSKLANTSLGVTDKVVSNTVKQARTTLKTKFDEQLAALQAATFRYNVTDNSVQKGLLKNDITTLNTNLDTLESIVDVCYTQLDPDMASTSDACVAQVNAIALTPVEANNAASWSEKTFTWAHGQPEVTMWPQDEGFCYLASMKGHYDGWGEQVHVQLSGSNWVLGGAQGGSGDDVSATAICIPWARLKNVQNPGVIQTLTKTSSGTESSTLAATSAFCSLSTVQGNYDSAFDEVAVSMKTNNTVSLYVSSGVDGAKMASTCISLGTSNIKFLGNEYSWSQGQAAVTMQKTTDGFCYLTNVGGSFQGWGEHVNLEETNGYWTLTGDSKKSGVHAKARCVAYTQ